MLMKLSIQIGDEITEFSKNQEDGCDEALDQLLRWIGSIYSEANVEDAVCEWAYMRKLMPKKDD